MRKGCEILKVKISEDTELVNQIRAKLKERNGLCPCKINDIQQNYCMCKDFLEQDIGECHCGLYIKTEK